MSCDVRLDGGNEEPGCGQPRNTEESCPGNRGTGAESMTGATWRIQ
jgi:hypothetical protein